MYGVKSIGAMQSVKLCENCDKFVVAPSHWTKASLTTYQKRSSNIMRLGSFCDYTPVYVLVKSQGFFFFPKGIRIGVSKNMRTALIYSKFFNKLNNVWQ